MKKINVSDLDEKTLLSVFDVAFLKPEATYQDLEFFLKDAIKYEVGNVCVKPSFLKRTIEILGNTSITPSTVISFPHGASTTYTKQKEAEDAVNIGAKELDMVMDIGAFKSGDYKKIEADIKAVKSTSVLVKVIVETHYLTEDEKKKIAKLVRDSGADYIKTSTGFAPSGAKVEDVKLFYKLVGESIGIKASGGIRTLEDVLSFLDAGATRIGVSKFIPILEEFKNKQNKKFEKSV